MPLFTIDPETCHRDGLCVADCPLGLIRLSADDPTPVPIADADDLCIRCGHCVAVCPHGAFHHREIPPASLPLVDRDRLPSADAVAHLFQTRRSVRRYRSQIVDDETLAGLIDIARHAPSGHNSQPVHWLVIREPSEVNRLAGMVVDWMRHLLSEAPDMARSYLMDAIVDEWEAGRDRVCRHAPHLILAHGPQDNPTAPAACTIALTHIDLAAPTVGLGTCWAGYLQIAATQWEPLRAALAPPDGHAVFGALMIGRPAVRYHRIPPRRAARIIWR